MRNWNAVKLYLGPLQGSSATDSTVFIYPNLSPTEQENVRAKFVELREELRTNGMKPKTSNDFLIISTLFEYFKGLQIDEAFKLYMESKSPFDASFVTPNYNQIATIQRRLPGPTKGPYSNYNIVGIVRFFDNMTSKTDFSFAST